MLIPITFEPSASSSSSTPKLPSSLAKISHDEVVLLELQGSLEIESEHPNERDGKLIGTLSIDKDLKRPTLRIGHNLMEGKLTSLPKPLAVLHRSKAPTGSRWSEGTVETMEESDDVTMQDDTQNAVDEELASSVQWNVVAIVKRKIAFSKRPMPLVGRQS